jgi:ABC-type transport system substrate-binding protein
MWERRMHSSAIPVPQNRWAGTNYRYYAHPEVDGQIARMSATMDEAEREQIEGALIERVTREAWFVPLYVVSGAAVVRKGITGVKPMSGSPIIVSWYYFTWNILEWDRSESTAR